MTTADGLTPFMQWNGTNAQQTRGLTATDLHHALRALEPIDSSVLHVLNGVQSLGDSILNAPAGGRCQSQTGNSGDYTQYGNP